MARLLDEISTFGPVPGDMSFPNLVLSGSHPWSADAIDPNGRLIERKRPDQSAPTALAVVSYDEVVRKGRAVVASTRDRAIS